jgi:hypothetical protein
VRNRLRVIARRLEALVAERPAPGPLTYICEDENDQPPPWALLVIRRAEPRKDLQR